uniref:Charged multivesicular body protein 7 n=1 Tax=Anopheles epiroticus TaxID=199890 RepID=A0A182PVB5_9DIPT
MKFWKDLIFSSCSASGSSVVSINMLKERFRRKGTVPYCLNTVFQDMLVKGELCKEVRLKDQQRPGTFGLNLWTAGQIIKAPIMWSYETFRGSVVGSGTINENENFVVKAVAQEHGKIIETIVAKRELQNKVIKYEELLTLLQESSTLTCTGIEAAVMLLEKENRVITQPIFVEDTNTFLVKFSCANTVVQPISSIEISIYELEQSESRLMEDITSIERNISQTMEKVREQIKNGQKQMAKTFIKKKHVLEKNMERKISALETLQGILLKIHNCQSDKNVIEAYKLGTNALKNALKESGITIDQLDETMAEMKHVLEQHDEILSTIGANSGDDVDELELEQELGDLIDIKLAETNIDKKGSQMPPSKPAMEDKTSDMHDFDTEIEKRLAALRVDVSESYKVADPGL